MRFRAGSQRGVLIGLAAAVSFGAATPFAKRLLEDARPQLLAGLLYLGAVVVLAMAAPFRRRSSEARLQRGDAPRLIGVVLCGGIVAPVLLLVGLERVSGSSGSLLLNLEGPFTLLIGLAVFGEYLGGRGVAGAAAVFAGGALLSLGGPAGSADVIGAACIAAACLLWAVDNNLTQSLTLRDPFSIVAVKVSSAAAVNLVLALVLGAAWPSILITLGALGLGAISYGASILLDAYALRLLGAAREAVIFATAPFVGAVLALPVLSETLSAVEVVAGVAMVIGIALMFRERHEHQHVHEPIVHEHAHMHDDHHQHGHDPGVEAAEPHSHLHRHGRFVHAHPHVSDLHHRHPH
jgi:drug/metabolite transporter (DMT)-like permease